MCRVLWREGESITYERNTLCFNGEIHEDSDDLVVQKLADSIDMEYMVVNSKGGDVGAAISIAENTISNDFSIVVDGVCLSSCANYFFVAAKYRYLLEDSTVGWHGGPPRTFEEWVTIMSNSPQLQADQKSLEFAKKQYAEMHELFRRQKELYRVASVSTTVVYDLDVVLSCLAEDQREAINIVAEEEGSIAGFWAPSVRTLSLRYNFLNTIRLGRDKSDAIYVVHPTKEPTSYLIDLECLYLKFDRR